LRASVARRRSLWRAAQDAWITYRDMMCEVEAGFMRGGSGEQMLRFGCLTRITEARLRRNWRGCLWSP
jgi:uncharacterized protein YecT (DUF1311 family)